MPTPLWFDADYAGFATGTQSAPYNQLTQGGALDDVVYYLKGKFSKYDDNLSIFPPDKLTKNNVQVRNWPGVARAILSGLKTIASGSWTFVSSSSGVNKYYTSVQFGGIALRGGVPLKVCHLSTGGGAQTRANSVASMVADSFLWDHVNKRIYINITGALTDAPLQVSTTRFGFYQGIGGQTTAGMVIDGIDVEGCSVHGLNPGGAMPGAQISNCMFRFIGGEYNGSYYYGNGLEVGLGSDGFVVDNCDFAYCYDAGFSPQIYSSPSQGLNGFTIKNSRFYECGLAGLEISTQAGGGFIRNGLVYKCKFYSNGYGASAWADSSNQGGVGVDLRGQGASGSFVTDITFELCDLYNNRTAVDIRNQSGAGQASRINFLNTRLRSPSGRKTNAFEIYSDTGSTGVVITMRGGALAQFTTSINQMSGFAGPTTVNLRHVSVIDNTTVAERRTGLTYSIVNSLLQSNGTLANGSAGSQSNSYNATRSNSSAGTYSASNDTALGATVNFDSTETFMPVSGSAIFTTSGTAQSPVFSDAFGNSFSPTWARNGYAAYATTGGSSGGTGSGNKPTSIIDATVGDSRGRGSDPYSSINENGGPTGANPYVSIRGPVRAALVAAGVTSVTSRGITGLAQPSRNTLVSQSASQGGAAMRSSQAVTLGQTGNSLEDNLVTLVGLYTDIDVLWMLGGANNWNLNNITPGSCTAQTIVDDWVYLLNKARTLLPGVTIVFGGMGISTTSFWTKAQEDAVTAGCKALDNGTTILYVDLGAPLVGYDPYSAADTTDGLHQTNAGATKWGNAFVKRWLDSFTNTGGGSGGGGGSTGSTNVSLLNTPSPQTKPGNGTATVTHTLGDGFPAGTLIVHLGGTWRGGSGGNVTTASGGGTFTHAEKIALVYSPYNPSTCAFQNYALKADANSLTVTANLTDGYATYGGNVLLFAGIDPAVVIRGAPQTAMGATSDGTRSTLTVPIDPATQKGDPIVVSLSAAAFSNFFADVDFQADAGWTPVVVRPTSGSGSADPPAVIGYWMVAGEVPPATLTITHKNQSGEMAAVAITYAAAVQTSGTIGNADQVQVVNSYPVQGAGGVTTARTYTLPNVPAPGNRIEVTVATKGTGAITVTDNMGNSSGWTTVDTSGNNKAGVYLSPPLAITNPAGPYTITLTPALGTSADWNFAVKELKNVHPTSPLRASGTSANTSASVALDVVTAGSGSTDPLPDDYVVSSFFDTTTGALNIVKPSGLTEQWKQDNGSTRVGGAAAFGYATAAGLQHALWAFASSATKGGAIVVLRANDANAIPVPVTGDLPGGTVGTAYSQTLAVLKGAPVTWKPTDPIGHPMPPGLALAELTGALAGNPTQGGTYQVYGTAANNAGSAQVIRQLVIADTALAITTGATLPAGNVGQDYMVPLAATGSGTLTWSIVSGAPPGISINPSTGVLIGKPTASGSFASFIVRVSNGANFINKTFSATIGSTAVLAAAIATDALPTATIGIAYSYQLPFTGSTPITVSFTTLPSGWSCSSGGLLTHSNPAATLTAYSITFTPSNSLGAGAAKTLTLTCIAAPGPTPAPPLRHITDRSGAGPFAKRTIR
jgi:hypothetical protein